MHDALMRSLSAFDQMYYIVGLLTCIVFWGLPQRNYYAQMHVNPNSVVLYAYSTCTR